MVSESDVEAGYYATNVTGRGEVVEASPSGGSGIGMTGHDNRLILKDIEGEFEVHLFGHSQDVEVRSDNEVTLRVYVHDGHSHYIEGADTITVEQKDGRYNVSEGAW